MAFLHNIRVSDDDGVFSSVYLQDAPDELIQNQGCRVITTGFQLPETGGGDGLFTLMYDYYTAQYTLTDFSVFADQWLTVDSRYYGP